MKRPSALNGDFDQDGRGGNHDRGCDIRVGGQENNRRGGDRRRDCSPQPKSRLLAGHCCGSVFSGSSVVLAQAAVIASRAKSLTTAPSDARVTTATRRAASSVVEEMTISLPGGTSAARRARASGAQDGGGVTTSARCTRRPSSRTSTSPCSTSRTTPRARSVVEVEVVGAGMWGSEFAGLEDVNQPPTAPMTISAAVTSTATRAERGRDRRARQAITANCIPRPARGHLLPPRERTPPAPRR